MNEMSTSRRSAMDFSNLGKLDAGLPSKVGTIPDVADFGDSGDVFNHAPWRSLFLYLSSSEKCMRQIVGLATQFMLRARQTKIEFKGSAGLFNLDISELNKSIMKDEYNIEAVNILTLKIVFATETTRVTADVLTLERFKCAIRQIIVPKMMIRCRFPATSCSIGFDTMANECREVMNWRRSGIFNLVESDSVKEKEKKEKQMEAATEIIDATTIQNWLTLFAVAERNDVTPWISLSAMTSASVSQKEIYAECEQMYPGTIFWAGVHALMTDVANKRKASESPADIRARLEHSNFYGDFKRKQNARGLPQVKSTAYLSLLEAAVKLMANYIKAGTGLTSQEVSVMDMLMKEVQTKFEGQVKAMPSVSGISTDSAADIEDFLKSKRSVTAGKDKPAASKSS